MLCLACTPVYHYTDQTISSTNYGCRALPIYLDCTDFIIRSGSYVLVVAPSKRFLSKLGS